MVSSARKDDDFKAFLLVGRSSSGKCSTGNSILGKKKFKTRHSFMSVTLRCQMAVARVQDYAVVVVDSPSLDYDTDLTRDKAIKLLRDDLKMILTLQPDGFDCILFTIPHGVRLTNMDREAFEAFDKFFGETYVKQFGIVVVTHADDYDPEEFDNMSLEEYTRKQRGVMAEMLEKCQGRFVCFDNRTRDKKVRSKQVKRLLDMVIGMKQSLYRYTYEMFTKAHENEEVLKQQTEHKLDLIKKDIEGRLSGSTDIKAYQEIIANLIALHTELIEDENKTGVLADTIVSVSSMIDHITAITENMKRERQAKEEILPKKASSQQQKQEEQGLGIFSYAKTFAGAILGTGVAAGSVALAPFTGGASLAVGAVVGAVTTATTAEILHKK